VQQAGAASIAVANDVGLTDCFDCLHSGQAWMTWSHTDEPDPTHATMPIPTRDTGRQIRAFG
jgi:hypothetical protein